jgi:hypothetical protein
MCQNNAQTYNTTFNTLLHLQTVLGLCDHREPLYDKGNQYMITVAARGRGGGPDRSPQGAPQHRKIDGPHRSALGCFEKCTKTVLRRTTPNSKHYHTGKLLLVSVNTGNLSTTRATNT